jgi:hypothetical protein
VVSRSVFFSIFRRRKREIGRTAEPRTIFVGAVPMLNTMRWDGASDRAYRFLRRVRVLIPTSVDGESRRLGERPLKVHRRAENRSKGSKMEAWSAAISTRRSRRCLAGIQREKPGLLGRQQQYISVDDEDARRLKRWLSVTRLMDEGRAGSLEEEGSAGQQHLCVMWK